MYLYEMFLFHSAMMLTLIALALGVGLVVWAARNKGQGVGFAKGFGWLIIIIAIVGSLCSDYFAVTAWYKGLSQAPMSMNQMQNKPMTGHNSVGYMGRL
ncbi:MAG TPA: hypothetical protein VGV92_02100 [Gammaproteobacteria bacterium]|nr:hypothetical protein [Gammaproteobacteria bacterium]